MREPTDVVAERWDIVVPGWVPDSRLSLNGRRRAHWRETWRLQQEAVREVIPAIWLAKAHPGSRREMPMMDRAQVSVTFVYPTSRRRDPDNLAGLAKPCIDALVQEGILRDDSSDCIALTISAVVVRWVTETRITVEPR